VVTFREQEVAGLTVVYTAKTNWKPNNGCDLHSVCVCMCGNTSTESL